MSRRNNCTTGQMYDSVIQKERHGEYLGGNRAGDPAYHRRDQAAHPRSRRRTTTSCIVEVGGTVGDIESLPFLEAIRQFRWDRGRENVLYIHLTLVPFIRTAGEVKTKPTQHSVKELTGLGHSARHPAVPQRPRIRREDQGQDRPLLQRRGRLRDRGARTSKPSTRCRWSSTRRASTSASSTSSTSGPARPT